MRQDDRQDSKQDNRWEFARLMYDTQNMLWSYNSTILWNQNIQVWFRNYCEAEAQSNLWNVYIIMQDNKMNEMNQDEQDRQDRMNKFYQLFQICKNIQILQFYKTSSQSQQFFELTDRHTTNNDENKNNMISNNAIIIKISYDIKQQE